MEVVQSWDDVTLFDGEEAEAEFWAESQIDLRLMESSVAAGSESTD